MSVNDPVRTFIDIKPNPRDSVSLFESENTIQCHYVKVYCSVNLLNRFFRHLFIDIKNAIGVGGL